MKGASLAQVYLIHDSHIPLFMNMSDLIQSGQLNFGRELLYGSSQVTVSDDALWKLSIINYVIHEVQNELLAGTLSLQWRED